MNICSGGSCQIIRSPKKPIQVPRSEELKPANNQLRESSYKWIFQLGLASGDFNLMKLCAKTTQLSSSQIPNSLKRFEITNVHCFKHLCFEINCYIAISNTYSLDFRNLQGWQLWNKTKDLRHIIKCERWILLDSWFEQATKCNEVIMRPLEKFSCGPACVYILH